MTLRDNERIVTKIKNVLERRETYFIFFIMCVVYLSNCFNYMSSTDTIPAILLPFSILDQHNIYLDNFIDYYNNSSNWWGTYFFTESRGHWVSSYPIVAPLLATPLYLLPYIFTKLMGIPVDMGNTTFFLMVYAMEKISAAVIAALSGVVFYLLLRELFDKKVALIGVFLYAFATSTWTIGSQGMWQHGTSELLLCLILLLLVKNIKVPKGISYVYLGILSGLLVFNRPTNAILLLPVLYYLLKSSRDNILRYGISLAAVSVPFLAYNLYFFGGLFGGYGGLTSLYSFDPEAMTRLAGLLISPSRGLFIYTPIALLAIPGFFYVKKIKEDRIRNVFYLGGLAVALTTLMYSFYEFWWGGGCYGPRFFTDIIPLIVIFVMFFVNDVLQNRGDGHKNVLIGAVLLLLAASVLVQVIGAHLYPVYGFQWGHGETITFDDQSKLWDWSDTQISQSLDGLFNSSNKGYRINIDNGTVSVSKG
ncbi:hypothetical protein CUJ83_04125 [Methanocella sp. CWC-04]|uniref:Glycosyltransferase RgtA/B/C/D-like domain-containing protein n=1 Tax=Methanooceanicella nereidis TaxID=2052831 RepID=A0AAP2RAW8_9EURY|nr:glycosyltransferase family 39 protein [Methanocella sp. CWC-04]MCD1294181.1 hypothetical protein [Methanocella sp. CWC-04]